MINTRGFFGILIGLVAASFIVLAATGHIALYDNSWMLFSTLSTGQLPFQHGRISYTPFYWPLLIAANHGLDVPACTLLFGLCFDLFTAAILSWGLWICRNRPLLMCGLLAGPFVGCLPGQIASTNEPIHIGQLGGVLILLASFAPPSTLFWTCLAASPFLFFAHPCSALAFFALACVLAVRAWFEPKRRIFVVLIGLLVSLCLLRASSGLDPYERNELTLAVTVAHFRSSFLGLPLVYVSLAWVGIALIGFRCLFSQARLLHSKAFLFLSYALLCGFAGSAFFWAKDPSRWIHALDFRRFAVFFALTPPSICALIYVVSANRNSSAIRDGTLRVAACITIAGFIATLQTQGWVFHSLCNRLRNELLDESRILGPSDLPWTFMTPLRGWFLPFTAILVQGKEPRSVMVPESARTAGVPVSQWELAPQRSLSPRGENQYFSFAALSAVSQKPRCQPLKTASEYGLEVTHGVELFWVKHRFSRSYTFFSPSVTRRVRVRFSAVSLHPDLPVRVVFSDEGRQITNQLVLRNALNAWKSPPEFEVPLELPTGEGVFEVRFECETKPVIIGGGDTREVVFLVRDLRIDMSGDLNAAREERRCEFTLSAGWHQIEHTGPDWLCWTDGRGRLSVVVSNDAPAVLSGQILSAKRPNDVDILLNGAKVASLRVDWTKWEFHDFLPIDLPLKAGPNTVEFVSHNPAVILPPDTRPLAVAVRNLQLKTSSD